MNEISDYIRARLMREADRQRLSNVEVARLAEVSPKTVSRFWAGRTFGLESAARISRALGVDWPA